MVEKIMTFEELDAESFRGVVPGFKEGGTKTHVGSLYEQLENKGKNEVVFLDNSREQDLNPNSKISFSIR